MRPALSRSGRAKKKLPVDQEVLLLGAGERHDGVGVLVTEELQDRARPAWPWPAGERSSGVLLSSASPVIETKTVGMHSVLPFGFSRM